MRVNNWYFLSKNKTNASYLSNTLNNIDKTSVKIHVDICLIQNSKNISILHSPITEGDLSCKDSFASPITDMYASTKNF